MNYAERAERYARGVLSGDVPAGKLVKLACRRHLDDMEESRSEAYPYEFVAGKANRVCAYLELLPHVKGAWARRQERIKLEDWQCFVYGVPFGWLRKRDQLRRFRRAYTEVPRKNAKSTSTAGLGLYMLTQDGEYGAEVYSGAGSEKQAWEVFGPARNMAKNTPALLNAYGLEVNAKSLTIPANGSKFEPIIGKPGDGASPSFSITDEYHEHATDEQYDTMVTGMGSREQAMAWVITTAGSDIAGPCYALRTEVVKMLEGVVPNDELFGMIYTIDEGDDWTTEAALWKANPNLGVSVYLDYLKSQQRDAINNARKQSTFKTKHLNVWVNARDPWMNMEDWRACADPTLKESDFAGEPCVVGLDMSSRTDITVSVKVFTRRVGDVLHYYAFPRFYLPEARAEAVENQHYQEWVREGHLIVCGEAEIGEAQVEEDIRQDARAFQVSEFAYDPWGAKSISQHLRMEGMVTVEVPQTTKNLSDPMKEIEGAVASRRFHHAAHPVMDWCISNVTAKEDPNENIFPRKESPENKIDGATALITAMSRAMFADMQPEPSITFLGFGG